MSSVRFSQYICTCCGNSTFTLIFFKPMIWWVYKHCMETNVFSNVVVTTDDERILKNCNKHNIKAILTSDCNQTGMDRMGEVALSI